MSSEILPPDTDPKERANAETPPTSRRTAVALLTAIPLALTVVVALELVRLPSLSLVGHAEGALPMVALAARAALDFLWAPTLFQLIVAAMAAGASPRLRAGPLGWLLTLVAAGGLCVYGYEGLTAYAPFRGYAPFIALFAALFGYLVLWTRSVLAPSTGPWRRHLRWALPLVGLAGFGALTLLNRLLFPDAYPTLHLGALQVSYVLLLCGLADVLRVPSRIPRARRLVRAVALGAFLLVAVLAQPLLDAGYGDAAEPAFRRFTDLGRSYALRAPARGGSAAPATAAAPSPFDDGRALALFRAHANLPPLPEGFELTRHNVLVVSVDAFRYREAGFFEGRPGVTPSLWALRERGGYWFERAYSPAPSTLQSFSALFTMTYPSLLRLHQETPWHGQLSARETTVAELFKAAGYGTFYAGHNFRMHHGHGPKIRGLLQGFDDLRLAPGGHDAPLDPLQDAIIAKDARAAIDAHRDRARRFFGWIFFESPHAPYLAHYPEMPAETEHARYRQEVRYVDEKLGELFAHLEGTGLMKTTVVVLLSDHGEGFGLHERKRHADVYSEVTRVPFAVFVPGTKPQRFAAPTSTLYLFPWLLQRGTPEMRAAANERLRTHVGPMLETTDGAIVSELRCADCARTALVYPEHRLVYDFASRYVELYARATDPDEQRNVFDGASPLGRKMRERLDGYLRLRASAAPPAEPGQPPSKDAAHSTHGAHPAH